MKRTEKEGFIEGFRESLKESPAIFLTDFSGLDVKSMTVLREDVKKSGAEFLVVKNRLVRLALKDTDFPDISEWLTGPTGVVIGYSGPVDAAKAVADFAKNHDDRPVFKVAVLDSSIIDPSQIDRLAKLPSRDVLLSMLAGLLEAPMSALVGAMEAKMQEMSGLLEALRDKQGGEGA
jgi:large subunit ribosomal protein L10